MKNYLSFLLFLFTIIVNGQAAAQWSTCIGGIYDDEVREIKKTLDGGSITVGFGPGSTGLRCMVTKLDSYGSIEWQRFYGSTFYPDKAYSITEASDGGYVFTGYCAANGGDVTGNHGQDDLWVVKLNVSGNIVWQKSLGGTNYEVGYSIKTTSDGGYIVAGSTGSNDGDVTGNHGLGDFWIIKLNSIGDIVWEKCLGGSGYDKAYSIQQTLDGGYIVSGETGSNDGDVSGFIGGYRDFWVVKLNTVGTIEWQKTFGGVEYDGDPTALQTSDGGYIVAGTSVSLINTAYIRKGLIIKLNSLGIAEWQKLIGYDGAFNYGTNINSIIKTLDGGYATVGTTINGAIDSNPLFIRGGDDIWFLKLDAAGNIEGQRSYGSGGDDRGTSIQQLSSGEYLLAGNVTQTSYEASCNHLSNRWDGLVIKLNSNPLEIVESFIEKPINIYPNPANSEINVKVTVSLLGSKYSISDQTGRMVLKGIVTTEHTSISLDNLAGGFYIFSIGNNRKLNAMIIKN